MYEIMLSENLVEGGSAKGNFIREHRICEECIVVNRCSGDFPNGAMVVAIPIKQSLVVVSGGLQPCVYSSLIDIAPDSSTNDLVTM